MKTYYWVKLYKQYECYPYNPGESFIVRKDPDTFDRYVDTFGTVYYDHELLERILVEKYP